MVNDVFDILRLREGESPTRAIPEKKHPRSQDASARSSMSKRVSKAELKVGIKEP